MKHIFTLIVVALTSTMPLSAGKKPTPPRLALFFIVDQLSMHQFNKMKNSFRYGFKTLLDKAQHYHHAYHQHAKPATATGHAAISTGTLACDHGLVDNAWFAPDGRRISCDLDASPNAKQLTGTGGKSARKMRVDGLSDQLMLAKTPSRMNKVLSLSLKSRSAIPLASKMGKAIWFDEQNGVFTSSKAYYEKLPSWAASFNTQKVQRLSSFTWKKARSQKDAYEAFVEKTRASIGLKEVMMGKTFMINKDGKRNFDAFVRAPIGNEFMLDLARSCLTSEYSDKDGGTLVLWISLSTPDLLGHLAGPESIEYIDTLYHLDQQLGDFLTFVEKKIGVSNPLIALTSDHGIEPIPEVTQAKGYAAAQRINAGKLIEDMNGIGEKFGIQKTVTGFKAPQFYLNEPDIARLTTEKRNKLIADLKNTLSHTPGIKTVWNRDELMKLTVEKDSIEYAFQKQLYPGRSGHFICYTEPYVQLTNFPTGTSHASPYHYDTHVPLFLYRRGQIEKKNVYTRVWIPQLPVTLAHLLDVCRPSASMYEMLPGIV